MTFPRATRQRSIQQYPSASSTQYSSAFRVKSWICYAWQGQVADARGLRYTFCKVDALSIQRPPERAKPFEGLNYSCDAGCFVIQKCTKWKLDAVLSSRAPQPACGFQLYQVGTWERRRHLHAENRAPECNATPRLQGFSLFLAYQVCNCWQPQAKMSWTCHEVSVRRARCNTVPTLGIVGFIRLMGDILHPLGPVGILMLLQTLRFMGYYRLVQDFVHQLFCDRREEVGFMLQDWGFHATILMDDVESGSIEWLRPDVRAYFLVVHALPDSLLGVVAKGLVENCWNAPFVRQATLGPRCFPLLLWKCHGKAWQHFLTAQSTRTQRLDLFRPETIVHWTTDLSCPRFVGEPSSPMYLLTNSCPKCTEVIVQMHLKLSVFSPIERKGQSTREQRCLHSEWIPLQGSRITLGAYHSQSASKKIFWYSRTKVELLQNDLLWLYMFHQSSSSSFIMFSLAQSDKWLPWLAASVRLICRPSLEKSTFGWIFGQIVCKKQKHCKAICSQFC